MTVCQLPWMQQHFRDMIDNIILQRAPVDLELAEGVRWLDAEAQKEGISFYQIAYRVLHKHNVDTSAAEWIRKR